MACPLALWARMGRWPMLRTLCQCPFLFVADWELKLAAKYGKYHNGELARGPHYSRHFDRWQNNTLYGARFKSWTGGNGFARKSVNLDHFGQPS